MHLLTRVAAVVGGALVVALLSLWLVEAVHRGHATGVWIVAVGLAALVIIPVLASRLRS